MNKIMRTTARFGSNTTTSTCDHVMGVYGLSEAQDIVAVFNGTIKAGFSVVSYEIIESHHVNVECGE